MGSGPQVAARRGRAATIFFSADGWWSARVSGVGRVGRKELEAEAGDKAKRAADHARRLDNLRNRGTAAAFRGGCLRFGATRARLECACYNSRTVL